MEIHEIVIQIAMGALGSVGFGFIFHLRHKLFPYVILGGVISWGGYLFFSRFIPGVLVPSILASACCSLYCEIVARVIRTPATALFLPSIIPLVPGGGLYYTMAALVQNDGEGFRTYGKSTLLFALGIALGSAVISAVFFVIRKAQNKE